MTIKLHTEAIRNMAVFLKYTGVQPKDCIEEGESIYFVVEPSSMTRAIGKDAKNIHALRHAFNKNVKLFPYSREPAEMIRGMIPQAQQVKMENGEATVTIPYSEKSKVIGRQGSNIRAIKSILKRHFDIQNLKVRA